MNHYRPSLFDRVVLYTFLDVAVNSVQRTVL